MTRNRTQLTVLMLALGLATLLLSSPTMGQGGRGRGGGRDRGGPDRFEQMSEEEREAMREQVRARIAEMEAQQAERMREELDLSDDEFDIIIPRIQAVQHLVQERQFLSGSTSGFGGGGGRGGRGGGGFDWRSLGIEISEFGEHLQEATEQLREVIEDEDADNDQIKEALGQLRGARDAMNGAITEAREDLRGLLTSRQEAQLVAAGVLD